MQQEVLVQKPNSLKLKLSDYAQLGKMRLASLVVFSAAMAFLTAPGPVNWQAFLWLLAGGVLTTASANSFNQVIERDLDKLMDRTMQRPIPDNRMTAQQGLLFGIIAGVTGIFILTRCLNFSSGLLGLLSIVLYTIAYTPLKRRTPFAVFIGAIPGAIPPLLGWVAATGSFSMGGWLLFSIQFLWQFPHFWAIAWVLDDDYKKAGFKMLPTGARDKDSAFQALLYAFSLLPLSFMPYLFGMAGWISVMVSGAVSLWFFYLAVQLFMHCDVASARKLMFGSFVYLPVVQIALVLDKI